MCNGLGQRMYKALSTWTDVRNCTKTRVVFYTPLVGYVCRKFALTESSFDEWCSILKIACDSADADITLVGKLELLSEVSLGLMPVGSSFTALLTKQIFH